MRTKAELAALEEEANGHHSDSGLSSSFLTEAQRAALDAALAAKQASPGQRSVTFHSFQSLHTYARQAQQAQLGMYWSNEPSPTILILCYPNV